MNLWEDDFQNVFKLNLLLEYSLSRYFCEFENEDVEMCNLWSEYVYKLLGAVGISKVNLEEGLICEGVNVMQEICSSSSFVAFELCQASFEKESLIKNGKKNESLAAFKSLYGEMRKSIKILSKKFQVRSEWLGMMKRTLSVPKTPSSLAHKFDEIYDYLRSFISEFRKFHKIPFLQQHWSSTCDTQEPFDKWLKRMTAKWANPEIDFKFDSFELPSEFCASSHFKNEIPANEEEIKASHTSGVISDPHVKSTDTVLSPRILASGELRSVHEASPYFMDMNFEQPVSEDSNEAIESLDVSDDFICSPLRKRSRKNTCKEGGKINDATDDADKIPIETPTSTTIKPKGNLSKKKESGKFTQIDADLYSSVANKIVEKERNNTMSIGTSTLNDTKSKVRLKWTKEEENMLIEGVRRFGKGRWQEILEHYDFNNRTNINLSDKWRNLEKYNKLNSK